jgi:hypothetical protein
MGAVRLAKPRKAGRAAVQARCGSEQLKDEEETA